MNVGEYRSLQRAVLSLSDSTALVMTGDRVGVALYGRCSPYVTHRTVVYFRPGLPAECLQDWYLPPAQAELLPGEVVLQNQRRRLLLCSTTELTRAEAILVRQDHEGVVVLTIPASVVKMLIWEAISLGLLEWDSTPPLVTVALVRSRLIQFLPGSGTPVFAEAGRRDAEVVAEAQERDDAALQAATADIAFGAPSQVREDNADV